MPVVPCAMKVVPVDDHGVLEVSVSVYPNLQMRYVHPLNDDGVRSPGAVAVIGFMGSQGNPTGIETEVYPSHSSRIPEKWDIEKARASMNPHGSHRWGPIPMPSQKHPASIVVSDIPKWFIGDPRMVAVPHDPSPYGKWLPATPDMNGTPEIAVDSVIVNPFPSPMGFENVSLVMKPWR